MKVETEKRRWAVLDHLSNTPGYELNEEILRMGAKAQGIPTDSDQIASCLAWLQDQELIVLRSYGGIVIAQITRAGRDVARGERIVPGIQRPEPGA